MVNIKFQLLLISVNDWIVPIKFIITKRINSKLVETCGILFDK